MISTGTTGRRSAALRRFTSGPYARAREPGSGILCTIIGTGLFHELAKLAILLQTTREWRMKALSAKDAKYNFGRMIDLARAEPVVIEKHGRPVVVVVAVEEYERLKSKDTSKRSNERT